MFAHYNYWSLFSQFFSSCMTLFSPDWWQSAYHAHLHNIQLWKPLELVFSSPTAKMSSVITEDGVMTPLGVSVRLTMISTHGKCPQYTEGGGLTAFVSPCSIAVADWSINRPLTYPGHNHSVSQEVEIETEVLTWTFDGRTLERGSLMFWCWGS